MLANILVNGCVLAGIYGFLSVAFALTFGVAKLLNMALTAYFMIASYFMFIGLSQIGLSYPFVIVSSIALTVILGVVTYYLCLDRVKEQESAILMITFALGMLFQEVLTLLFSKDYRTVPQAIVGFTEIGGVRIMLQQLFAVGVSGCTLIGLWVLLSKTKLGNAIRTVSQDREVAGLVGIDVSRICMIVTAISVGLAAVAGTVLASIFMIQPEMWMYPLVIVLAAAVLGGLGSIKGSFIAALILGFSETAVVSLFPKGAFLKGSISLGVMIAVLFFRPEGLFGIVFEEERL